MSTESPRSQPNPYRAPPSSAAGSVARRTQGMVGHAPVVGTLMVVQGVLNCLMGVVGVLYAVFMPGLIAQAQQQAAGQGGAPLSPNVGLTLAIGGGILALVMFTLGGLLIYSGISVTRYRRRTLALVALASGMLTLFTCYCFPTSLALGIYGMFFLLNQSVARAFAMRSDGKSVKQIQQEFFVLP